VSEPFTTFPSAAEARRSGALDCVRRIQRRLAAELERADLPAEEREALQRDRESFSGRAAALRAAG
jgi:hypothetical protein